jgi:hypothetical protein
VLGGAAGDGRICGLAICPERKMSDAVMECVNIVPPGMLFASTYRQMKIWHNSPGDCLQYFHGRHRPIREEMKAGRTAPISFLVNRLA